MFLLLFLFFLDIVFKTPLHNVLYKRIVCLQVFRWKKGKLVHSCANLLFWCCSIVSPASAAPEKQRKVLNFTRSQNKVKPTFPAASLIGREQAGCCLYCWLFWVTHNLAGQWLQRGGRVSLTLRDRVLNWTERDRTLYRIENTVYIPDPLSL